MRRCLLVLWIGLAGCPPSVGQQATSLVEEGRRVDAVDLWIAKLTLDLDASGARAHTIEAAQAAWDAELAEAASLEAQGRADEALPHYDVLIALDQRLRAVEITEFDPAAVKTRRETAVQAASLKYRTEADALVVVGRWDDAIAAYDRALGFTPADPIVKAAKAHTYRAKGDEALTAKKYGTAIAAYESSMAIEGDPTLARQLALLHRGWGLWALEIGQCRDAAVHLERAVSFSADDVALLEQARACARTEVMVEPFVDESGLTLTGVSTASIVSDAVNAAIGEGASPYLKRIDPENPPPPPEGTHRYAVRGRVTQIRVDRPEVATEPLTTRARTMIQCDERGAAWDDDLGYLCPLDADIVLDRHVRRIEVHTSASVRVVETKSGEQAEAMTWERVDAKELVWADRPRLASPTADIVLAAAPGYERWQILDPAVAAIPGAEPANPTDTALVPDALRGLAGDAGKRVLTSIDSNAGSPEPSWLPVEIPKAE